MTNDTEMKFLKHSNWIETEYSEKALEDAIVAWEYLKKQDITLKSILTTHMLLMRNLDNMIAGRIRNCDVWIGGNKKHHIAQKLIEDDLELLCEAINASITKGNLSKTVAEEVSKDLHIEFEGIHPFVDGNGRTGRHILNRHRMLLGLPILTIHQGEEQYNYYKWFRNKTS